MQDQNRISHEEPKILKMLGLGVKSSKRKTQGSLDTWAPELALVKKKKVVLKRKKKKKKEDDPSQAKLSFPAPRMIVKKEMFGDQMPTMYKAISLDAEESRFSFDVREESEILQESILPSEADRSLLAKSDSCGAIMIDQDDKDCSVFLPPGGVYLCDYYRVAFPVDVIVTMATAGGRKSLPHSELAMVIDNVWWRNKTFEGAISFKDFIVDRSPARIELGPIHPFPSRKLGKEFKMDYLKHLVFDIDVDDEHYMRWCNCKGYKMTCSKCWALTVIGIKITVHMLKKAFGFKHILEVYSGRRGAHIWVFDQKTLEYDRYMRGSIVDYIDKHRNPSIFNTKDTDIIYDEVIEPAFDEIYLDGDALTEMDISKYALLRVPYQKGRDRISDAWWDASSGRQMWDAVEAELEPSLLRDYKRQIAFGLLWVHLDTAVTTNLDHLVKCPFVVHPGTGHICTPIPYHDWTPEEALTKEMIMVKPGLLKPYVEHAKKILSEAYNEDEN